MSTITRSRFGATTRRVFRRRRISHEARESIFITVIILAAFVVVTGLLFVVATSMPDTPETTEQEVITTPEVGAESFYVNTIDGKRIPCVTLPTGVSCNWNPQ